MAASVAVARLTTDSFAVQQRSSNAGWAPWARRALFYLALLAIWQLVAAAGIWPPYVVPGPQAVGASLADGFASGAFLTGAAVSVSRLAIGYGISVGLGTALGVLIARSQLADELLGSLVLGRCSRCRACAGCRWPFCGSA
ncbi:MAG TPA: hypothetical protein VKU60_08135 [Chloroflexota bacterium]|nr:hypothetical protein [Chloroflexota bacterium]